MRSFEELPDVPVLHPGRDKAEPVTVTVQKMYTIER
jgi:hypothetical protein